MKSLGRFNSTTRTADQLQIARFWADGAGTYTPPGNWNEIAQQVAAATGNSIAENARLFAKLDIALADAAILAWKAKYETTSGAPLRRFTTPISMETTSPRQTTLGSRS